MDSVAEAPLKFVSPDESEGLDHYTPQACEARFATTVILQCNSTELYIPFAKGEYRVK